MAPGPQLSIVVPLYKEKDNVRPLHKALRAVIDRHGYDAEIVLVDDGSPDGQLEVLAQVAAEDPRVRVLKFRRNAGQTAAMEAGILAARGAVVVTLDGDLQNDPEDIPLLLAALDKADCACGDRTAGRKGGDTGWKVFSSRIANGFRNRVTGDTIRDAGCCFRAFKREAFRRIKLFRGLHRFLPTLMRLEGFTVVEVPIKHHPRHAGKSNYGTLDRLFVGMVDCFAIAWMRARTFRYEVEREISAAAGTAPVSGGRAE
jgi:glycosyltransferase involved in cell wall biosynthesis